MKETTVSNNGLKFLQWGMHDAFANGQLLHDIPTKLIFVKNTTERDELSGILPGTFVAAYGLANIWQRNGDDTWETIR